MEMAKFDPSAGRSSGSSDGEKISVKDLVGKVLLVQVKKLHEDVKTKFGEKNALDVDVCGVETGKVVTDQRWFNGAVVDALAPYVGQVVPVKLAWTQGSGPNPYISAEALSDIEAAAAQKFLDEKNPFSKDQGGPALVSVGTTTTEAPRW